LLDILDSGLGKKFAGRLEVDGLADPLSESFRQDLMDRSFLERIGHPGNFEVSFSDLKKKDSTGLGERCLVESLCTRVASYGGRSLALYQLRLAIGWAW
jgi:hypothetical protein